MATLPFGRYGPKEIQQKGFLGHPIDHAVFVCADSFTYGIYDEYIGDEDDDEEEYTEVENESGDDQRGAKKIENN